MIYEKKVHGLVSNMKNENPLKCLLLRVNSNFDTAIAAVRTGSALCALA